MVIALTHKQHQICVFSVSMHSQMHQVHLCEDQL